MPSKIHDAVARQWELLKILPSRGPGKSCRELAQLLEDSGFKVTKRTVERDLNKLLSLFPIEFNDKSIPHGWHWVRDACFDLPGLTLAEALSIRLLDDYLKPLLPLPFRQPLQSRFQLAMKKIQSLSDNPANSWLEKVRVVSQGINLIPPNIDQKILEAVQEALFRDEQLTISYHAMEQESAKDQVVHPLGIVQKGPVTYLIATAFNYQDIRIYAVHRIVTAEKTGNPCVRPKDFSIDEYIKSGGMNFGDGEFIRLKASVSDYLVRILEETPLSEDMKITEKNGKHLLSCTVANTGQLLWWILSLGDGIEILTPKKLRDSVIESFLLAGKCYKLWTDHVVI
jgi:predicted DNA-binding transcriptional regulator YafY